MNGSGYSSHFCEDNYCNGIQWDSMDLNFVGYHKDFQKGSCFCAGWSNSCTSDSINQYYMEIAFCKGVLSFRNSKRPCPNCLNKAGSTELSGVTLYCVALQG